MPLPGYPQRVWILLAGLTWAAQVAQAADADLEELSLEQLLEVKVVSASKFEQRGRDAPSAVQVISREEIQRHGWRTLTEALNTLPGLYVSNDKAYDFQGARGFQIPGDYNTRFLLLVDGQRNNDNIYQSALTGVAGWLDLSAVERIEYIPGPGSALYGSNAMFGVINVITRQGEAKGGNQAALRLSRLWGNGINLTSSQTFKGSGQDTRVFLQFSADNKTGRDQRYDDPLGQLLLADGSVSPDGVAHGLDNGRNQRFMARIDQGEWSLRLINHDSTRHPSSAPYGSLFNDPAFGVTDSGTQVQLSFEHALSDHSSLNARVGYTDFIYRGSYAYLDAGLGYYLNFDDARGQTLDGELSYQWRGGAHRVVAGVALSRDLQASQKNFNSVPAASLGTADVDINTLVNRSALFVQDTWQLHERLALSAGLRLDSATGQDATTSPRLAAIWQAAPDWTLKLLAGRAYRAANAYESQFGNGTIYLSNPSLQGETIRTTEGVVEWRSSEGTRWQVSLYQNQLDKLISQIDTGSGLQFQNQGSTTVKGAELGLEQQQASGLLWRASVAFNQASSSLTASVDNSPRWLAKASASAPVWQGRMTLAGELQAIGPRDYTWNASPYAVPTEVLANLTATYPNLLRKGLTGQLRISNLFDHAIAHPASAEILIPTVPQPGREFSATLTYAF
jgi:iron complex outermembrane receptor protein